LSKLNRNRVNYRDSIIKLKEYWDLIKDLIFHSWQPKKQE